QEARDLQPLAQQVAEAEQALADERAAFEQQWGDGVPAPSGQAAEVRGELAALRAAIERGEAERARVTAKRQSLAEKHARLGEEAGRPRGERAAAGAAGLPLVASIAGAERRRAEAEAVVGAAEESHRAAQSELHAWRARAEALALALDEARSKAGAERL